MLGSNQDSRIVVQRFRSNQPQSFSSSNRSRTMVIRRPPVHPPATPTPAAACGGAQASTAETSPVNPNTTHRALIPLPVVINAMLGVRRNEMGRTYCESRSTDLCPRSTADYRRRREILDDWMGHRAQYVTQATGAYQRTTPTPPWPSIVCAETSLRRRATVSQAVRFTQ